LSVLIPRRLYKNNNFDEFKSLIDRIKNIKLNKGVKNIIIETIPEINSKKYSNMLDLIKCIDVNIHMDTLSSKDYGIPQNRQRTYIIFSKINSNPLNLTRTSCSPLSAFLDTNVDDKYIMDTNSKNRLSKRTIKDKNRNLLGIETSIMHIVNWDKGYIRDELSYIWFDFGSNIGKKKSTRNLYYQLFNINAISPTIDSDNVIKIIDYDFSQSNVTSIILSTLPPHHKLFNILDKSIVRQLTPSEYFRLQGINEYYINNIRNIKVSDTQKYNMAEGGQDINILRRIIINLLNELNVSKDL
jgi:site-specific DNA-cytosine methylase